MSICGSSNDFEVYGAASWREHELERFMVYPSILSSLQNHRMFFLDLFCWCFGVFYWLYHGIHHHQTTIWEISFLLFPCIEESQIQVCCCVFVASLVYVPKRFAVFTSRVWAEDLATTSLVAWFKTSMIALHSDLWSITLYTQIVSVGGAHKQDIRATHAHTLENIGAVKMTLHVCSIWGRKNEVSTTPMPGVPEW